MYTSIQGQKTNTNEILALSPERNGVQLQLMIFINDYSAEYFLKTLTIWAKKITKTLKILIYSLPEANVMDNQLKFIRKRR